MNTTPETSLNFIHEKIDTDLANGVYGEVLTRFPPEPNGYLHIGHAKSICLNFGTARKYGGKCNLRFDDTNPVKEDQEYVDAIEADVRWLGFDWEGEPRFASDYFDQMYGFAEELIGKGLAYVCTLSPEEFKEYRGVPTRPGKEPPNRSLSIEENLDISAACGPGNLTRALMCCGAKLTWHHRTCTCAIRCFTGYAKPRITVRVTPGVFIRATTSPIV